MISVLGAAVSVAAGTGVGLRRARRQQQQLVERLAGEGALAAAKGRGQKAAEQLDRLVERGAVAVGHVLPVVGLGQVVDQEIDGERA